MPPAPSRLAGFLSRPLEAVYFAARRMLRPARPVMAGIGLMALGVMAFPAAAQEHDFNRLLTDEVELVGEAIEKEAGVRLNTLHDPDRKPPTPSLKPPPPPVDVPADFSQGILIDISDRKLYWIVDGKEAKQFGIAVPREGYRTYLGDSAVTNLRPNPVWVPTPNMRRKNPALPERVGPGPANPLGTKAIGTGWKYIYIHGTNQPDSIGTRASSGCFRMHNADVEWLFERVDRGTPIRVRP